MPEKEESFELYRYWQILWRHKWVVLLAVIVVFAGTVVFTSRQSPVYSASSKVLISPPAYLYPYSGTGQLLASQGLPYSQDLPYYINYLENYKVWLTGADMMDKIREEVKSLYPKSEQIPFSMSVSTIPDTSIFNIAIEAGDPELCKVAANASALVLMQENERTFAIGLETASELIEKQILGPLEELDRIKGGSESPGIDSGTTDDKEPESQLWQASQLNNVRIMDYARTPTFPIRPKKKQNAALGLLVGIFLGGGLAFFLEYMDTSIRTIGDIEKYLSWPVLGIVPRFEQTIKGKASDSEIQPVVSKFPKSASAEAYRTLRTNIQLTDLDNPPKFLVVTSAIPLEGKSTTALNLAVALAQKEGKVLLVDADLRKPTIHKLLHLDNSSGFADLLVKNSELAASVKQSKDIDNLWVLTSGSIPSNPSELLGSSRMKTLVEQMKKEYEYVILDTPPLISVSDSAILASQADGIVMVVRPGKVKGEVGRRTKELLERIGTPVLGCVFNCVEASHRDYYYYYNYYHYYAGSEGEKKVGKREKKESNVFD